MFYITLEVDKNTQEEAKKTAELISNILDMRVVGVYPQFQTGLDNTGQTVIYTGYHPPEV